jgi:hypothetical protein
MFSAGFEPETPPVKRPQTYTLDRTAAGIGTVIYSEYFSAQDRLVELYEEVQLSFIPVFILCSLVKLLQTFLAPLFACTLKAHCN